MQATKHQTDEEPITEELTKEEFLQHCAEMIPDGHKVVIMHNVECRIELAQKTGRTTRPHVRVAGKYIMEHRRFGDGTQCSDGRYLDMIHAPRMIKIVPPMPEKPAGGLKGKHGGATHRERHCKR